jgi:hypothetical protein
MATLVNAVKQKLEHLFGMQSGYVLDFSNSTFYDFILTSVNVDVDIHYNGSKASKLRQLWQQEPDAVVAKLMLEMLERWQTNKLMESLPITNNEQLLYDKCVEAMNQLAGGGSEPALQESEAEFLAKDFGDVDISQLSIPVSFRDIMQQRLDEIHLCLNAKAPLAVIFLCGSTLEGLLYEVAAKNPQAYNRCVSAPQYKGSVKPLADWTLENLIVTSKELNVVSEDVVKHAHAVKDFRNYIHPKQQLKDSFKPRMITAEIASKVLDAAISDLNSLKKRTAAT